MPPDPRRILAMGGGGFTMADPSPALDRYVLELTGVSAPRVCFLPTASGDPREQATRFHERFGAWPCEPSILSLFHLGRDRLDPQEHLLAQDAIYVGGGSMRNMLAIWREHGLERVMRSAWERGIVLAGLSAGAMCWLDGGVTKSGGRAEPVVGLGLVHGSLSVHLGSEPERLPVYRDAVATGRLGPGWAVDDGAALLFEGTRLTGCVSSRTGARVVAVAADGDGGCVERELEVRALDGATSGGFDEIAGQPGSGAESAAIDELRALRAGRDAWR